MALSITNESVFTVYEIPLRGMEDHKWEDRSWIVEHLHQLADKIEESKFKIYSIGLEMNHQYNAPTLVLKGWEQKEDVIAKNELGTEITLSQFQGLHSNRKWEIFSHLINVDWRCPNCGNKTPEPQSPFMGTIQCEHCDYILSHRSNGGQSNPFNWVFSVKEINPQE